MIANILTVICTSRYLVLCYWKLDEYYDFYSQRVLFSGSHSIMSLTHSLYYALNKYVKCNTFEKLGCTNLTQHGS